MKLRTLIVGTVALSLLMAAVASSAGPRTRGMVLRLADAPAGFSVERSSAYTRGEAQASGDLKRMLSQGWIEGWEADFVRKGLVGALQIVSAASLYSTSRGASSSIRFSWSQATRPGPLGFRRTSLGGTLGHEARMYLGTTKEDGIQVDIYTVLWRFKNVKAALLVGGVSGTLEAEQVVDLARRQQKLIVSGT